MVKKAITVCSTSKTLVIFGSPGRLDQLNHSDRHVSVVPLCVWRQQWWHRVGAVIHISEPFMVHLTCIGDLNLETQI